MKSSPKSITDRIFSWTDRFLSAEVKADPDLHLRTQIGLFTALFGTAGGLSLIAYAAQRSENPTLLVPFMAGVLLAGAVGVSMFVSKSAARGIVSIVLIFTLMNIAASYSSGGFNNSAMVLFPVIPMYLATFASSRILVLGTLACIFSLLVYWYLSHTGHVFPVIVEQTPDIWFYVSTWAILNAAGIAYFTQHRFREALTIYKTEIKRRTKVEQSLRHTQQRLRLAKGAAEAGSQAKGRFLAQVSHEIRNPLTAIMGTIDLLELPAEPAVRAARIELLRRSSTVLLELVDDVLDYSKMEAGRIEINRRLVDPVQLIEDIERTYRPQAVEHGLDLLLEIDPAITREVMWDPLRIRQVLINLVSNALKFTPEGSITIELWSTTCEDGRNGITIGVEDTGIGIPESAHSTIFEPYGQAELSTTEIYGGTGLGLPISSRLVGLMGGQFGFETTEGVGTRFWFQLPVDRDSDPEEQHDPNITVEPGQTRVLVVEDDPMNRQVVGELLCSLGHNVTLASGGVEGVERYRENQPDLVLMDIRMPDITGIEASRRIRQWEAESELPKVPILAMTADVELHRVARYGEAGMNDLLRKPISRDMLEQAIRGWALRHRTAPPPKA